MSDDTKPTHPKTARKEQTFAQMRRDAGAYVIIRRAQTLEKAARKNLAERKYNGARSKWAQASGLRQVAEDLSLTTRPKWMLLPAWLKRPNPLAMENIPAWAGGPLGVNDPMPEEEADS